MTEAAVVVEPLIQSGSGEITQGATPPVVPDVGTGWQTHIPAEYKAEKLWEPLKDKPIGDVLKGYAESQKLIGGSVKIPGAEATPEERAAFNRKLGAPEAPDGYDLGPALKSLPPDDPTATGFKKTAHLAGLTQSQVAAMTSWYVESLGAAAEQNQKDNLVGESALKGEWGAAFDFRASLAARAARQFGGDELVGLLDSRGIGSHPAVVKMFEKLGREMAEDGAIVQDAQGIVGPNAAIVKINAINGNMKHPYWLADDPGHKAAVAEMTNLRRIAQAGIE